MKHPKFASVMYQGPTFVDMRCNIFHMYHFQ